MADIAAAVEKHADMILRASGSGLRHYTMKSTRDAILSAVIDCYEEAYRAGAEFAGDKYKSALSARQSQGE